MDIFVITTCGLEPVGAQELATIPAVTLGELGYRRVSARCEGALAPLLALRTVDDVFLAVAVWDAIGRTREALAELRARGAALRLYEAAAACADTRPLDWPPVFSVTASFVGQRNYAMDEIKEAVAQGITATHGWAYTPDDAAADLNVRVFIEHATAQVGVRLGAQPLHRRHYKQAHVPGSLKPPVAAAMVWLAGSGRGLRLLDPFCGAGTIPIEAAGWGMLALGGDCDPAALEATRANAAGTQAAVRLARWDACALPLASASVDRVVSNLPWGRQAPVGADLGALYHAAGAELARVLAPTGRAVLLTTAPEALVLPGLSEEARIEVSVFGQRPQIVVLAVT